MTAKRQRAAGKARSGVRWEQVKKLALALPGAEESTSYGTPAFKVKGQLFARLREEGDDLVVRCELADRELLLDAEPRVFHVTDHYLGYPWILVRLAEVSRDELRAVLTQAWRLRAPKKLLAALARAGESGEAGRAAPAGLSAATSPSRRGRVRAGRGRWRS